MIKKLILAGFIAVLVFSLTPLENTFLMGFTLKAYALGEAAPDFTLKDIKGNDVMLSSFRGRKVLLVFGATWCPYCVREVADLNAFYAKHRDKDIKILALDIRERAALVNSFAKKYKIQYTVLLDTNGEVSEKYQIYGIPTNILIDENGKIKYRGSKPEGGFDSLLK